jgi:hypothetical protein
MARKKYEYCVPSEKEVVKYSTKALALKAAKDPQTVYWCDSCKKWHVYR